MRFDNSIQQGSAKGRKSGTETRDDKSSDEQPHGRGDCCEKAPRDDEY